MSRYTFGELSSKRTLRLKCTKCGKKFQTTVRAYQTINPFNRDKNGMPKSADQIIKENDESVDLQVKQIFDKGATCLNCDE